MHSKTIVVGFGLNLLILSAVVLGCAAAQPQLAANDLQQEQAALAHVSDVVTEFPTGTVRITPAGTQQGVALKVHPDRADFVGRGMSAVEIAGIAYGYPQCRVVAPYYNDDARFDVEIKVNGTQDYRSLLKSAIIARFPFRVRPVRRELPVYELTAPFGRVRPTAGRHIKEPVLHPEGRLRLHLTERSPMSKFINQLEFYLDRPLVDETGVVEPQAFELEAAWAFVENRSETVTEALYDQLGLRLTPAKRDVDVLLVEPTGFRN